MKCPICGAEIDSGALSCPSCHAFQVVERTPLGVLAGWVGILASVLTAMILIPLPFFVILGGSLAGFPWVLPIIGLCLTVGSLWYSRSTKHTTWLARDGSR